MTLHNSPDLYHNVRLATANHRASNVSLTLMEGRCHQSAVDEYQAEVLEHLLHIEELALPDLPLIKNQPEIDLRMRPMLLDFLMEVVIGQNLSKGTFPLAVNLIDRYCLSRIIKKAHFQLLGLGALWVACKSLESKPKIMTLDELSLLSCHYYQKPLILQMEKLLLKSIDWNLSFPTFDAFIDLYVACAASDLAGSESHKNDIKTISTYICELVQFYPDTYFNYLTLQVALAAVITAILVLGLPVNVALMLNRINLPHSPILTFPQYQLVFQQFLKFLKSPPPSLRAKYFGDLSRYIGLMCLLIAFINENIEPVTPTNNISRRVSAESPRRPPTPVSTNISPNVPRKSEHITMVAPRLSFIPTLPSPNVSPDLAVRDHLQPSFVSECGNPASRGSFKHQRKRSHQLLAEDNPTPALDDTLKRSRSTRPVFFIT